MLKKKSNLFSNSNILMLKIRRHKCNGYLKKKRYLSGTNDKY